MNLRARSMSDSVAPRPATSLAGSDGVMKKITKVTIVTAMKRTTAHKRRLIRYRNMRFSAAGAAGLYRLDARAVARFVGAATLARAAAPTRHVTTASVR